MGIVLGEGMPEKRTRALAKRALKGHGKFFYRYFSLFVFERGIGNE
jgi:hypothetical protein